MIFEGLLEFGCFGWLVLRVEVRARRSVLLVVLGVSGLV